MNIVLFYAMPDGYRLLRTDARYEHIVKVLRLVPGDRFLAGEVNGYSGIATLVSLDDSSLVFSWEPEIFSPGLVPVVLVVAQVRPICMKRILREAASFGVSRIIVTGSDTGERSYRDAKIWSTGEYRSFLMDGAMQSACTGIGECLFAESVDTLVEMQTLGEGNRLVLDNGTIGSGSLSGFDYQGGEVVLAIGPERGWSDRERSVFETAGFLSKTMGKRVLRTETACAAGISILLSRMGIV